MPEEPEVELPEVREEREQDASARQSLRAIALSTAFFAALAAVAALRAGGTVNEALLLKTEATEIQSQASDQWALYQAKGVKSAIEGASAAAWIASGKPPPPEIARNRERYAREQAAITQAAIKLEQARDRKSAQAEELLHAHHRFADSVALLQVAIALAAVAALTRVRAVWVGSLILGGIGAVLFFRTLI
jgi:lipopolysaccharide export LptBFGC system permease protein LptF